ncbi:hypothetical protein [Wolbachia endosymbiont of Tetranychus urticae]|uniref:hypothetical protein n=1 Tax=Wolbachia endosymbiont of Tetranychus urticae TaxID=169184 RepID=UPI00397BF847
MVDSKSLPFLFGVLSRCNNYLSYGNFTSELGKWYSDTSKTDNMLQLLTGSHNYNTSYVAFYRPPQLYFLQGKNGTFIYNELYLRYAYSSNQYQYPYALLGVIFVKNKTNSNITRTLNFAATSHWSSGYEGVGLFVGIPSHTDNEKSEISEIKWSNIYNYSSSNNYFTASGSIQIPANKTVSIILYTTPYQHYNNYNYYSQYMQWGIYNFRSNFLTDGLEVDIERTLKAWQCPGLANTFEIWR